MKIKDSTALVTGANRGLGLAYAKALNRDQARLSLERALKLKPDFAEAADARRVLATLN